MFPKLKLSNKHGSAGMGCKNKQIKHVKQLSIDEEKNMNEERNSL